MDSLDHQSFNMFSSRQTSNDPEDFNTLYPEPPHGLSSFGPMHLGLSPDAFGAYPRPGHETFPAAVAFDGSVLYADAPYNMYGRMSPGIYAEDREMPVASPNRSTTSVPSAPSSAVGSPRSNHGHPAPLPDWVAAPHGLGVGPAIVGQGEYFMGGTEYSFVAPGMEDFTANFDFTSPKPPGFVDPSLIHPDITRRPMGIPGYDAAFAAQNPAIPSPALSNSPQLRTSSTSPYPPPPNFPQYGPYAAPVDPRGRRPSMVSFSSNISTEQPCSGDEAKEKQRCPHPECGKVFKDLKAHMLTHQNERPEKCPIQTCDYHVKGFARKYDKNRHTLTHYKGTMVCGFCPGSGSAAEKSFNRADVFKRHLTAVHGVEQTPPNSRKKTAGSAGSVGGPGAGKKLTGYAPDATGKCSTCSATFSNAQDFYEHLDDCVLRIVQQEDPAEAVNARRLAEVENDPAVLETLEKNQLPTSTTPAEGEDDEDDDDEMAVEDDEDDAAAPARGTKDTPPRRARAGNPANGVQKSRGMTHSHGGVPLQGKPRSRKSRRDYPTSWGFDKGQMTMKKRVMAVFDGPRRLVKDDMMLSTEHEVRVRLADGKSYVTDLDVQTMRRAEGFLGATDEEKGPWLSDDPTEAEMRQMLELGSA